MSVNPYDATPYPDLSYVNTHPDRLATMASLLGLRPAPVRGCRVLEVGCAAGGNLLPMALHLPTSEFVGIDYAPRQIEEGERRMAALGLTNVRLVCADLTAVDEALGSFDYIVAHGVYSWTPPAVRDGLLALVRRLLRPQGVAFVSYNTYPGWHITQIVREAMLFHSRTADSPEEKAADAKAMLHFMAEHAAEGSYGGIFRSYADFLKDGLKGSSDAFLLHDELEETNDPVYFHQFVSHAARHDLQYLSEVELREVLPSAFAPEVQTWLKAMATDTIALEQYMDFLRNRMFRQTLLCRADAPLQRTLRPEPLYGMTLRSQAKRAEDFVAPRPGVVQFKSKDNAVLTTDHPLTVAALTYLARVYPQALSFADLVSAARTVPGVPAAQAGGPPDELIVAANLLRGHAQSSQLVSLHSFAPALTYAVSARPTANAVARWEAATRTVATNGWHERVTLQPSHQRLLPLLDGTRTPADLAAACAGELSEEEISLQLQWFAYAGLLVG